MSNRLAAAERMKILIARETELRDEMDKLCRQYGLLSQELLIIIEALKLDLKEEMESVISRQSKFPRLDGYLVD